MDFHFIFSYALRLYIIIDPIGMFPVIIPFFSGIKDSAARRHLFLKEMMLATLLACMYFFAMDKLKDLMDIKSGSIKIAGGILLIIIGIKMTYEDVGTSDTELKKIFTPLFPVATPLVCGPGTITFLILIKHLAPSFVEALLAASIGFFSAILSFIILFFVSNKIPKKAIIALKYIAATITILFGVDIIF